MILYIYKNNINEVSSRSVNRVTLTQDVLNQDVSRPRGLGVAGGVHSINTELALFALLQVGDGDFGGWVQLVGGVHPPPIRRALLVDLDDVTLDGAATIFVWRSPAESDAALGLVFNLGGSR